MNLETKIFSKGVHNLLNAEIIPQEASQDEQNWYSIDGVIKLINGKEIVGAEGAVGKIYGQIFGYKADGTKVHWRKIGTKIQYLNGSTWTDVVTGLSEVDYAFSNYSSLAGTFTFAFGADGIYKFHNANPGSYISLYNSAVNFKGKAFIDRGRTILWDRAEDKTGLYGSFIDRQDSTVYTAVSNEVLGASGTDNYTGTLAFKAGGATRNCFAIVVTGTTASGLETFTDNLDGTLTSDLGGSGTINYITGAYDITFSENVSSGNVEADYQWEDSNSNGVTDFTKSGTRAAGEGFVFPQDEGGDAILNVVIGQDGAYYSIKENSIYRLALDETDTNATNEVYRKDLGIPSYRAAVSTGKGVVFLNTANSEKPEMTILQRNITDNIEPVTLFPHFKFANYTYDDCTLDTYERYILVACKSSGAVSNDTILLCNPTEGTVDITEYQARTFAKSAGDLYAGSSVSQSVYKLYDGYDDDGSAIDNFYITKDELFGTERLKKYRKIRLKGRISADQYFEVYANYDNSGFELIGTIRGDADYVDYNSPQAIGANLIGEAQIGGDDVSNIYPYFAEIKLKKQPKFRKRALKFIAKGIGYVDINYLMDYDLSTFEEKIPSRYRLKQDVSLDGQSTNQ